MTEGILHRRASSIRMWPLDHLSRYAVRLEDDLKASHQQISASKELMLEFSEYLTKNKTSDIEVDSILQNKILNYLNDEGIEKREALSDIDKFNILRSKLRTQSVGALKHNNIHNWDKFKVLNIKDALSLDGVSYKSLIELQELVIKHNLKCGINP